MANYFWAAICAGMTIIHAGSGYSQEFPGKTIRIMTAGVGGGADFASRIIAQNLARPLGQQVVVENRGGIIPQQAVAQAAPDGHTLLLHSGSTWLAPFLEDTPYDPIKDYAPITWVTRSPSILVVHPSLPVKSVKELIAMAKAKPGALNYSSAATGSTNHLTAELFKAMAGVNIVGIAYRETGQATSDVIAGHVHMMFPSAGGVAPHIKSGRLRGLGVTSAQPSALYPQLPTIAAAGVPGYESVQILGLWAPAKTPVSVVSRLNQEVLRVLERPDIKEKFLNAAVETVGSTPEQFAATIKADMTRMGKVIKDAGIRAN